MRDAIAMERSEAWVLRERNAKLERMQQYLKQCEQEATDAREEARVAKANAKEWQRVAERAWEHQKHTASRVVRRALHHVANKAFTQWLQLTRGQHALGRYRKIVERVVEDALRKMKHAVGRKFFNQWRRFAREENELRVREERRLMRMVLRGGNGAITSAGHGGGIQGARREVQGRLEREANRWKEELLEKLSVQAETTYRVKIREFKRNMFMGWREAHRVRLMHKETTEQVAKQYRMTVQRLRSWSVAMEAELRRAAAFRKHVERAAAKSNVLTWVGGGALDFGAVVDHAAAKVRRDAFNLTAARRSRDDVDEMFVGAAASALGKCPRAKQMLLRGGEASSGPGWRRPPDAARLGVPPPPPKGRSKKASRKGGGAASLKRARRKKDAVSAHPLAAGPMPRLLPTSQLQWPRTGDFAERVMYLSDEDRAGAASEEEEEDEGQRTYVAETIDDVGLMPAHPPPPAPPTAWIDNERGAAHAGGHRPRSFVRGDGFESAVADAVASAKGRYDWNMSDYGMSRRYPKPSPPESDDASEHDEVDEMEKAKEQEAFPAVAAMLASRLARRPPATMPMPPRYSRGVRRQPPAPAPGREVVQRPPTDSPASTPSTAGGGRGGVSQAAQRHQRYQPLQPRVFGGVHLPPRGMFEGDAWQTHAQGGAWTN